jgi:hypothetical protein
LRHAGQKETGLEPKEKGMKPLLRQGFRLAVECQMPEQLRQLFGPYPQPGDEAIQAPSAGNPASPNLKWLAQKTEFGLPDACTSSK